MFLSPDSRVQEFLRIEKHARGQSDEHSMHEISPKETDGLMIGLMITRVVFWVFGRDAGRGLRDEERLAYRVAIMMMSMIRIG